MAEAIPQTKKIINPRVEIDTSPPFESVKEAVNLFGGRSAPWTSQQLQLPLDADSHSNREVIDINKMEEQAARLERVLITRERETVNVLRELEDAKSLVEDLKVNLMQGQGSTLVTSPVLNPENSLSGRGEQPADMLSLCPPAALPCSILMNFDKTTANLNKTAIDLSVIRASVESLNKIMSKEKGLIERSSEAKFLHSAAAIPVVENHRICRATLGIDDKEEIKFGAENSASLPFEHPLFNFEAEQFKKMVEASRYEIMQAMSEIERTKVSIRMAEMRLHAARKIEEAAKAVEAIAFSESKALLNGDNSPEPYLHKPEEITLSFEEYNALSYKAKQADEMCKTKFMDANGVYKDKQASLYPQEAYKKSSLEAAFTQEGDVYKREVLEDGFHIERSEYEKMQDSGHGSDKFTFRNFHPSIDQNDSYLLPGDDASNVAEDKNVPFYRSTISIGDILTRKLILQNDVRVGKNVEARAEKRQRSLSQLLREQSGLMLHHSKSTKDGSVEKHFVARKKKFGFIRVPLSKNNKKNTRVSN